MRRGWLAGMFAGALVAGCGGTTAAPPQPAAAAKKGAAQAKERPPYLAPGRWSAHLTGPSHVTSMMRLADGRCLLAEYSGQRWITWPDEPKPALDEEPLVSDGAPDDEEEPMVEPEAIFGAEPSRSCNGRGRAAVERAPEPLVGIVRWPGAYAFVGASGTIHEAKAPLGRFTRRIAPPEPVVRVRGSGSVLLAATETGKLLRWDRDAGYTPVALGGRHAIDVAVSPGGKAVALAIPEAVFTSEDEGRSFTRAAAPPIAAARVGYPAGGPFLIEGGETSIAWDPKDPASFPRTVGSVQEGTIDAYVDTGRSAHASVVSRGTAALDGERYWEVSPGYNAEWVLWKGTFDGQLRSTPLPMLNPEAANVLIAARKQHAVLAELGWDEGITTIAARVSHDEGATFGPAIPLHLSDRSPMGMAVAPDGTALLTGVCLAPVHDLAPQADVDVDPDSEGERSGDASCVGTPLLVRNDGTAIEVRAPSLAGPALTPAFSMDGKSAYFVGPDDEDGHLALFVSHDGGGTFEKRELRVAADDDDDEVRFEADPETTVTVSERGTVGMMLAANRGLGRVYVTTDADGKNAKLGELPLMDALGSFGERVITALRSRGSMDILVQESLDGGATWSAVEAPIGLKDRYFRDGDVACGAAGCLVGEDFTRVGWGDGGAEALPFEPAVADAPVRPLRTPIVCEPKRGSSWTRIEHVADPSVLPDEHNAARGRSEWMVTTLDPETGAVAVVMAVRPESGDGEARIVTKPLLAPLPKGTLHAVAMRQQIEGVAVARTKLDALVKVTGPLALEGRRMKDLEVAWENLQEGSSTRAVVADAGEFGQDTILYGPLGEVYTMALDTLSVSPKGVFVRVSPGEPKAMFVDTAGKVQRFALPDLTSAAEATGARYGDLDAVNVDGTFVVTSAVTGRMPIAPQNVLLMVPPAAGSGPDAPWRHFAETLAPLTDRTDRRFTRVSWTYEGGHLAVWMLHAVPSAGYATAWMQRVKADGTLTEPVRLPTPYDLEATPRACTASERATSPRLVYPEELSRQTLFTGTRHAVLVTEPGVIELPKTEATDLDPDGATATKKASKQASPASAAKKPRRPPPIGRVPMITSGVVMRGAPGAACVDAFGARIDAWTTTALVSGDLRSGWFFRLAGESYGPTGDARSSYATRNIEVRPLTCHHDPAAIVR